MVASEEAATAASVTAVAVVEVVVEVEAAWQAGKNSTDIQPIGTPRPTIFFWLFRLDDEPNPYMGDGWKSPNIH